MEGEDRIHGTCQGCKKGFLDLKEVNDFLFCGNCFGVVENARLKNALLAAKDLINSISGIEPKNWDRYCKYQDLLEIAIGNTLLPNKTKRLRELYSQNEEEK